MYTAKSWTTSQHCFSGGQTMKQCFQNRNRGRKAKNSFGFLRETFFPGNQILLRQRFNGCSNEIYLRKRRKSRMFPQQCFLVCLGPYRSRDEWIYSHVKRHHCSTRVDMTLLQKPLQKFYVSFTCEKHTELEHFHIWNFHFVQDMGAFRHSILFQAIPYYFRMWNGMWKFCKGRHSVLESTNDKKHCGPWWTLKNKT